MTSPYRAAAWFVTAPHLEIPSAFGRYALENHPGAPYQSMLSSTTRAGDGRWRKQRRSEDMPPVQSCAPLTGILISLIASTGPGKRQFRIITLQRRPFSAKSIQPRGRTWYAD
jgi:hypothetical protein